MSLSLLVPRTLAPSPTARKNGGRTTGTKGEDTMADRVAVITGSGTGIGRASALALMNDGWSVVLCGRRKEMLEETAGMKASGRSLIVPTDVTDPAQVYNLFAQTRSNFGRIDMLFNNAGGGTPTTNFGDFTYEMWL